MAKHAAKCPKCGHRIDFESAVGDLFVCSHCNTKLKAPSKNATTAVDPLIGQTLGQFEITALLGKGGMGAVYKGRQPSLGRDVAIKVLPQRLASDSSFIERFHREARAAAAISHPNIIEVHDIGEDKGHEFIAMEFIDGESLSAVLKRERRLPADRALDIMKHVTSAIAAAHGLDILHRDIKPANILLDRKGRVKVADFGLAKRTDVDVSVTHTGQALGTPLYIPPEATQGKHLEARSDLYSLGATFYHLLAGQPPFQGTTGLEIALKHVQAPVPPLQQLAPDTPPTLCRIIHRLLRKNPAERYASADEVLQALERVALGTDVTQDMAPSAEPTTSHVSLEERLAARKQKHRRTLLMAGVGGGIAVVALVLFLVLSGGKKERPQARETGKTPPITAPATPAPVPPKSKDDDQQERNAAVVFKNAEAMVDRVDYAKAKQYLERLKTKYGGTEFCKANRVAIEALQKQVDDALDPVVIPVPPEPPKAKAKAEPPPVTPEPPQPKPKAEPKGEPPPPAAKDDAEKKAAAEKRRQEQERFLKAMQPVEARVKAWDFAGAMAQVKRVAQPPSAVFRDRLAAQNDELTRLAKLKAALITRVKSATPKITKRALRLKGIGGNMTLADEKGLTAKLPNGKTESFPWKDLSVRSVQELLRRSVLSTDAEGNLAAGILLLRLGDAKSADAYFGKAKTGGIAIERYLDPLAEAAFVRAKGLLEKKKFADTAKVLTDMEAKYAKTPWFAAHKDAVKAAKDEAAAETLYAQAAKLFAKKDLFDLKPIVAKLQADYPNTPPVTDATRKPTVAEMAEATAKLGKFLTVRQDGKGDFTTIQAAIDAAPPNSLIEIRDSGHYGEVLVVHQEGVVLRGARACWPVVMPRARKKELPVLLEVGAPRVTIEHLVLVHRFPAGRSPVCLLVGGSTFRLRTTLVYSWKQDQVDYPPYAVRAREGDSDCDARDSVFIGPCEFRGPVSIRNCLAWQQGARRPLMDSHGEMEIRSCTLHGTVQGRHISSALIDTILDRADMRRKDPKRVARIEGCCVFGRSPFAYEAKPGKRCFTADPQFRDPENLDYRLKPTSPCRKRASDGGDIGCQFTPEMLEMLKLAHELRKKGIIKF